MNIGQQGEELAAREYVKLGYRIIGRNVRLHASKQIGELDVIVTKNQEIVFVEVKTRRTQSFGHPADAIGYLKRRRLINAAQVYLLRNARFQDWHWRIDVAEVRIDKSGAGVIIIPNAIEDY
jgi:putative endonuclease